MKIFKVTPKNKSGEVIGNPTFTEDEASAVMSLAEGHDVMVADCFFHPVKITLTRVRSKGEKEDQE